MDTDPTTPTPTLNLTPRGNIPFGGNDPNQMEPVNENDTVDTENYIYYDDNGDPVDYPIEQTETITNPTTNSTYTVIRRATLRNRR